MVKTRKEQLSVSGGFPGDTLEVNDDVDNFEFAKNIFNDELVFRISGVYSGAGTGTFDPPYPLRTDATINEVVLMRRTAGGSGNTTIDVLVNGNSIFDGPPKPSIAFSEGDNAIDIKSSFDSGEESLSQGDYIDVELDSAETGSAEGLIVLVRITRERVLLG